MEKVWFEIAKHTRSFYDIRYKKSHDIYKIVVNNNKQIR